MKLNPSNQLELFIHGNELKNLYLYIKKINFQIKFY